MKISEVIEVQAPPAEVWELFQDVPELAQCLPGAELTEDKGDGTYAGRVSVKLGPMTATFEGEAKVSSDPEARSGSVSGKGVDKSGGSVGQVKVAYQLEDLDGGGTKVDVDSDIILSGAAAQFGRTGLIKEMSSRLIGEFVQCLEAKLAATTPEEASQVQASDVKGFSLFLASLGSSIAAFFRRLFGGDKNEESS